MQVEETLTIKDIQKIFHVSPVTIYRWVNRARAGQSRFPLPIGGHKQKLCWSKESIVAFQNANSVPLPAIESASQRQKRHSDAMKRLQAKGVVKAKRTGGDHVDA